MNIDAIARRRAAPVAELPGSGAVAAARAEPSRETATRDPALADYDVVVVGGGPAGLAAGALCARKFLRTAVLESDSWGGVLTRWCPDKRIDNYPGLLPGIQAGELAGVLLDDARRAQVDLIEKRVDGISRELEVMAGAGRLRGRVVIVATGSTAAEAEIVGEKEFSAPGGGVYYSVPTPAQFTGRRVVVVGGGDTAASVVQRLRGFASGITLVHRQAALRAVDALGGGAQAVDSVDVRLRCVVEAIFGGRRVEGVRLRNLATGEATSIAADAVVLAVGRRPNTAIFRDLDLALDAGGQVKADFWQRTNVRGILAVGDVSSSLKMIVTAVAQGAAAAHEAYREVRSPYWK